ncbi:hypothetical protein [Morganella morganii]|nr:hypothetical protein [Morganella morganii]WOZ89100.1 hypothetical protein PSP90_04105 [Morganella morganii]
MFAGVAWRVVALMVLYEMSEMLKATGVVNLVAFGTFQLIT